MKSLSPYYRSYIVSEAWYKKRRRILKQVNYTCYKCGGHAKQVHHLRYDNLGREPDKDLRAVCVPCHKRIEMWKSVWKFVRKLIGI